MLLDPNTLLKNRYRIIRLIGRGQLIAVYEAYDSKLNNKVIVKEGLRSRSNKPLRSVIAREAQRLTYLSHPGLPKVVDYFTENIMEYLVTEYVGKNNLKELLEQKGKPLAVQDVLIWADQLLDTLTYLHSQQSSIIHRNITPTKLIPIPDGKLVLLDLSLAAGGLPEEPDDHGLPAFTPGYSSPEQVKGKLTNALSDIYSVGATLYHLLTGVRPIDVPQQRLANELNPQVPSTIAQILARAMALNPDDRFESAAQMRAYLNQQAGELPEVGVPEVEQTISENILSRLSPSLQEALLWAEGLRLAVEADTIWTVYLLAGLYQKEPMKQLLTMFDDDMIIRKKLEHVKMTETTVRFTEVRPAPPDHLSALRLSYNADEALTNALGLTDQKGSPIIHSQYLLAGLLEVPKSFAGSWISDTLGVESETLYQLISEAPDETLPLDEIRRASTRTPPPISREEALARIQLVKSDLLDLQVDALVHPTSPLLRFRGSLGKRLLKRVGYDLYDKVHNQPAPVLGEALVTDAGPLAAYYLIHTPIQDAIKKTTAEMVAQGTKAALSQAEKLRDVQTIGFHSMGTTTLKLNPVDVASKVLMAVIEHLEQGSNLEQVVFAILDDHVYQVYLNFYKTLNQKQVEREAYRLALTPIPKQIPVAQRITLQLTLQPAPPNDNTFSLPPNIAELYCFITADGLQVSETDAISIALNPATGEFAPATFELQAHLVGKRSYTVELFVEDPESGRVRIFKTGGSVTVVPPEASEPRSLLPTLDVPIAPQADLTLCISSYLPDGDNGPHHLTYYLSSRLPDLRLNNKEVGRIVLHSGDLARLRALLSDRLVGADGVPPEDVREEWLSFGTYLFDLLFPRDETMAFREAFWKVAERVNTLLIIEDGVSWLPWELVVPYDEDDESRLEFLGERYQLCRWVEGLGPPRYHEIPFGEVALAHYELLRKGQEEQEEELAGWRRLLNASGAYGIAQVVKPETPVYGIHVLLHTDQMMNQREIVRREQEGTPNAMSLAEELPQTRLDLRLKRPVMTLSMLNSASNPLLGPVSDEWWLPARVLPFLRAGASAVVAPWWPTGEEADKIFWATFHELLARRVRLGDAVWRARLAVKRALPQRADWLAYTAFGDPRARPYWPEESEGYTALECLNADEPLQVGKRYYFRVSIRHRPPIWHQDRLIQPTMEAAAATRRAVFLLPDFEPPMQETMQMTPLGRAITQATIEITPQEEGEFLLIARLFEGRDMLQSLTLEFEVGERGDEEIV